MTIKGVDVSSYQSSTFSTKGLSFAFIKATEGTSYISPRMTAQAAHARSAGLVTGFYHFMHPGNPKGQAAYFVEKCASVTGDLLVLDWEPTSSGTPSNADKDTCLKEIKRLRPDHKVLLYCDVSRWTGVDKTSYCGDGLWIADPNHPAGHPNVKHPWVIHQYGISGTDVDVANFASKAALKAWATGSTPAPPSPHIDPEESDMQLTDAVVIGDWIKREWKSDKGLQDGKIQVQTALGSAYGHARATHDATTQILAELKAQRAALTTLAGLVGKGVDTAAVVAAVEKAIADAVVHVEIDTGDQT